MTNWIPLSCCSSTSRVSARLAWHWQVRQPAQRRRRGRGRRWYQWWARTETCCVQDRTRQRPTSADCSAEQSDRRNDGFVDSQRHVEGRAPTAAGDSCKTADQLPSRTWHRTATAVDRLQLGIRSIIITISLDVPHTISLNCFASWLSCVIIIRTSSSPAGTTC